MKKLINISLIAIVAMMAVGCNSYNDFGIPEVAEPYTDADFTTEDGCEIISIRSFKDTYSYLVGSGSNELITDDWVIRGKVVSSDESGNIYKSLYIQDDDAVDGRAAIELRLFASNYTKYPMGYTVYVKLKDLSIGDYGGMISVGAYSLVEDTEYPHTTIENRITLNEHIFLGESGEVTEDDVIVVDASNYESLSTDYLACLIRFEGLTSAFTEYGSASWTSYTYPSYFSSSDENFNWSPDLADVDPIWENPPMAYKGTNPATDATTTNYYYGSAWYTFDRSSSSYLAQFIVRLSGYARFKDNEIPSDGTKVNITSIFTQYKSGSYTTYQIVPRFEDDIVVVE